MYYEDFLLGLLGLWLWLTLGSLALTALADIWWNVTRSDKWEQRAQKAKTWMLVSAKVLIELMFLFTAFMALVVIFIDLPLMSYVKFFGGQEEYQRFIDTCFAMLFTTLFISAVFGLPYKAVAEALSDR